MGCKNCSGKFQGQCDCCLLVDGDKTFKEVVRCEDCNAFICKKCDKNWIKRSIAYLLKKFSPEVTAQAMPIVEDVEMFSEDEIAQMDEYQKRVDEAENERLNTQEV